MAQINRNRSCDEGKAARRTREEILAAPLSCNAEQDQYDRQHNFTGETCDSLSEFFAIFIKKG